MQNRKNDFFDYLADNEDRNVPGIRSQLPIKKMVTLQSEVFNPN